MQMLATRSQAVLLEAGQAQESYKEKAPVAVAAPRLHAPIESGG
jgi:hypothetical protein